jgi:cytoskeletal protein CcmA (bactofilin family)
MFTKGSKDSSVLSASFQKVPAPPSLLAADLLITGDIVSAGEIQIDGRVNGNIQTDVLVVGESAQITGEIRAENVRIHGRVNGQIKARTVSLAKTAHVMGDILHENLAIEQGAYLEGHCRRIESQKKDKDGDGINLLAKGASIVKAHAHPEQAKAAS